MILRKKESGGTGRTRKLSSKLGLLGFLGFLGFTGFLLQLYPAADVLPIPFPFFFFAFFGFFGFYYEGKMSDTLIDERFERNAYHASAVANKIGLTLILLVSILSMSILRIGSPQMMLSVLIATIGISFGLSVFLQQYLLYRYENEE